MIYTPVTGVFFIDQNYLSRSWSMALSFSFSLAATAAAAL